MRTVNYKRRIPVSSSSCRNRATASRRASRIGLQASLVMGVVVSSYLGFAAYGQRPPFSASTPPQRPETSQAAHSGEGRKLILHLPATSQSIKAAIVSVATIRRVPLGAELFSDSHVGAVGTASRRLDLTHLSTNVALQTIVEEGQHYSWSHDDAIRHVRPKSTVLETTALDLPVPEFSLDSDDLRSALTAVHRLFAPSFSAPPLRGRPARVRSFFQKPLKVRLEGGTARGILDELAVQHGGLLWIAEYATRAGTYPGLRLSLIGFDGWVTTSIAPAAVP